IRDTAAEYGEGVLSRLGARAGTARSFAVRVGVSTGQSVLTTVGDDVRAEFTATGETASLAARLQAMAEPGTVLIAQTTYAPVKRTFETVPAGAAGVRRIAEPVMVYEVLERFPGGAKGRGTGGLAAPLVGRERELRQPRHPLARLGRGAGSFITTVGA